jgi:RNase P subunit RPR2
MLKISKDKLNRIISFCEEHGDTETIEEYGINHDTLSRYKRELRIRETTKPKILLLDIETAPMDVMVWGLYKQRISHTNVVNDWFMLSWSAKYLFDADTMSDVVTPEEAIKRDDSRICRSIWTLINNSDVIIGHNIERFDRRKLNARFFINKLAPPLPYVTIDTLTVAQKNFGFSSNRLDYLGKMIRDRGKIETNFDLWVRCKNGEQDALTEMVAYNKEDVVLLEEVYLELRPWIKSHVNLGLLMDAHKMCCPTCGSYNIELMDKYYTTPANQYQVVRCKDCGAPNRLPKGVVSFEDRKNLVRSIAR